MCKTVGADRCPGDRELDLRDLPLDVVEEAMQSPVEPPTSSSQYKTRRRARLYKAACCYFSIVMANTLHKYAVANSRDDQQARWKELIAPVNARLSPWILLFSVRETWTVRLSER